MTKEEREKFVEELYKKERLQDLIVERDKQIFISTLIFIVLFSTTIFVWYLLRNDEMANKVAPISVGILIINYIFDIILTLYDSSEAIKEEKEKYKEKSTNTEYFKDKIIAVSKKHK